MYVLCTPPHNNYQPVLTVFSNLILSQLWRNLTTSTASSSSHQTPALALPQSIFRKTDHSRPSGGALSVRWRHMERLVTIRWNSVSLCRTTPVTTGLAPPPSHLTQSVDSLEVCRDEGEAVQNVIKSSLGIHFTLKTLCWVGCGGTRTDLDQSGGDDPPPGTAGLEDSALHRLVGLSLTSQLDSTLRCRQTSYT